MLFAPTVGYYADVVTGVQQAAGEAGNWSVEICPSFEAAVEATRGWTPDGVLVGGAGEDWPGLLGRLGCPAVQIGGPAMADVPRVTTDNHAIGRMAATHFADRGFTRFAFVGYARTDWSDERLSGFRQVLAAAGRDCATLQADRGELAASAVTGLLADWLAALPKPVALFAVHDRAAVLCANACAYLGLRVPEGVAILGVDNNLVECGFARPALSSVMGSARRIGYEGAALLQRLMDGGDPPGRDLKVPPAGVAVRPSSDVLAIDDADLVDALRFIRRHAAEPIRVADVAEAMLLSRRLLERKFRAHLGRSPREEILRVHLEEARTLLASTDLPLVDVAVRSGFPSASKFSAVFHRETGLSPSAFRRMYGTPVKAAKLAR